jgi:hypothetical protein
MFVLPHSSKWAEIGLIVRENTVLRYLSLPITIYYSFMMHLRESAAYSWKGEHHKHYIRLLACCWDSPASSRPKVVINFLPRRTIYIHSSSYLNPSRCALASESHTSINTFSQQPLYYRLLLFITASTWLYGINNMERSKNHTSLSKF